VSYPQGLTDSQKVSNLALGLALVAGMAVNWNTIVSLFGSRVLAASLAVALVCLAAGYACGYLGGNTAARTSTAMVSGVRFGSLGLVIIGTQLHANSNYLGPVIVFSLVNLVVVMFAAIETGRRAANAVSGTGPVAPVGEGETPAGGDSGLAAA
jgi:hypothetical protein